MLFNSYVFICIFLPVVWIIYFGLNHFRMYKVAEAALFLASLVFYGYGRPSLCLLILSSVAVNYILHCILSAEKIRRGRPFFLWTGILFNLSLLFYFKYFDFFLKNVNTLFHRDIPLRNVILPLGISFYTFQQISFLVDSSKQQSGRYKLLDYALFVTFFPQLVAGPIVLHREMIPQFHDEAKKKVNPENVLMGLQYFILGFGKKVLVADVFARICDAGYARLQVLGTLEICLIILAFTMQIFFDFSGYSDMAIGLAKMFNIDIPRNFNSPYKSGNISEFWDRWHMTLTRFLTMYIYIPLGGNRKGQWRTYVNILLVFAISGFWHGANWNFIMWGLIHGILMVFYRLGRKVWDKLPAWLAWGLNFAVINLTWVFFRADYPSQPFVLLRRLFSGGGFFVSPAITEAFQQNSVWKMLLSSCLDSATVGAVSVFLLLFWFVLWTVVCVVAPSTGQLVEKTAHKTMYYVMLGILFAWSFMNLSQVSKFIYFNF